jgi:hypothetical protein
MATLQPGDAVLLGSATNIPTLYPTTVPTLQGPIAPAPMIPTGEPAPVAPYKPPPQTYTTYTGPGEIITDAGGGGGLQVPLYPSPSQPPTYTNPLNPSLPTPQTQPTQTPCRTCKGGVKPAAPDMTGAAGQPVKPTTVAPVVGSALLDPSKWKCWWLLIAGGALALAARKLAD